MLKPKAVLAASNRVIDVSTVAGVDPTGATDSTAGFQTALTNLQNRGGGQLYIPPGQYVISSTLTFSGPSLSIQGCGQTLSVLVITQPIVALSVTLSATAYTFTAKDFGFSAVMPNGGGTAIAITGYNSGSTTQSCLLDGIDFSVLNPNYTAFKSALVLSSLQRANIRDVNFHSNVGIISKGCFASLSSCVDVRFNNCSIDIVDTAFFVAGYSEGLHIVDCIVANTNVAISTGASPYSGNGSSTPYINLLGLYITDCEFNCDQGSAYLAYTNTAWISNTHFSTGVVTSPALAIMGCAHVQVANCEFTGQFNPSSPANWTGVVVSAISGWGTNTTVLDGCLFNNLGLGVSILSGAYNTTAFGIRFNYGPGLVGNPVTVNGYSVMAYQDQSGNTSNEVQTLAAQPGSGSTTNRVLYSR